MKHILVLVTLMLALTSCGNLCTEMACYDWMQLYIYPESSEGFELGHYSITMQVDNEQSMTVEFDMVDGAHWDTSYPVHLEFVSENIGYVSYGGEELPGRLELSPQNWFRESYLENDPWTPSNIRIEVYLESELIHESEYSPEYTWHWCNGEDCDSRKNYRSEHEIQIQ